MNKSVAVLPDTYPRASAGLLKQFTSWTCGTINLNGGPIQSGIEIA